jgi:hypothetical protein
MARIRSIHPGLTSDESFMSMSMTAKAAWPLLWTECDDGGAFEWKPIVLKARLFPADAVDFAAVLAELVALNCVKKVEIGGREYGLVRNFCRYQRPKKPNYRVLLTGHFRTYVGLTADSSEPDDPDVTRVPNRFHTGGEKSPQMEDEGGRRKGKEGKNHDHENEIARPPVQAQAREAFPPDGSIAFTAWADRARKRGRNIDVDLLASAFRLFCRERNIALEGPWVERTFDTFVSKHKIAGAA